MFSAWKDQFPDVVWPEITFESGFAQVTCKQALMRGKWRTAGKVTSSGKLKQSSLPDGKRAYVFKDNGETIRIILEYDAERGIYRSKPKDAASIVSIPRDVSQSMAYMKNEGDELEEFMTPDGSATDIFEAVLRGDEHTFTENVILGE